MATRRVFYAVSLALGLLVGLAWSLGSVRTVRGDSHCVNPPDSIQAMIDKAGDHDTIRLATGVYTETLDITKSVTLQGGWSAKCTDRLTDDPSQTVIDANRANTVVRILGGDPWLEGLTITGGWSDIGGGIHTENASATLSHVIVSGNTVSTTAEEDTCGAGLYLENANVTLKRCEVSANVAHARPTGFAFGAGICLPGYGEHAVLIDTRISGNIHARSTALYGGGIYVSGDSSVEFQGSQNVIEHNWAYAGGGIYLKGTSDIAHVSLVSNTATTRGGGIAVDPVYEGRILNNLVVRNSAGTIGSGISVAKAEVHIANNTLVGNEGGTGDGVGIEIGGTPVVTLTNNVILGHQIGIRNLHGAVSPTLVTNDLWKNEANYVGVLTGSTDVSVAPQFMDAAGGDYHLASTSTLIDAGTAIPWLTVDFERHPRPIGASHDIGAYEWGRFGYIPLILRSPPP